MNLYERLRQSANTNPRADAFRIVMDKIRGVMVSTDQSPEMLERIIDPTL